MDRKKGSCENKLEGAKSTGPCFAYGPISWPFYREIDGRVPDAVLHGICDHCVFDDFLPMIERELRCDDGGLTAGSGF